MSKKKKLIEKNDQLVGELSAAEAEISRLQMVLDLVMPIALSVAPPPVAISLAEIVAGNAPPLINTIIQSVLQYGQDRQSPAENALESITTLEDSGEFTPGSPAAFRTNAVFWDGSKLLVRVEVPALPEGELTPRLGIIVSDEGTPEPFSDDGMSDAMSLIMASSAGRLFNSVRMMLDQIPRQKNDEPES